MLGMSWPWNWGGSKSETFGETIREATQQTYGKKTKLATALEAAFVDDMADNLAKSRANVQAYTAAKVPGIAASKGGADMDRAGIIVADNIRYDNSKTGGAWRSVAAIILGLATIMAMTSALPILLEMMRDSGTAAVAPADREIVLSYEWSNESNTIEFTEEKPE